MAGHQQDTRRKGAGFWLVPILVAVGGFGQAFVSEARHIGKASDQTRLLNFDIDSQDLKAALRDYALISGQQLAYDGSTIQSKTSTAINGQYTAEEALKKLLQGTALDAHPIGGGVYLIHAPSVASVTHGARYGSALDEISEAPSILIVRGVKASLSKAFNSKKRALQIRDSLVAEDIGKLPDYNMPEALQRLSGMQIGRDRGEATSVTIRGLNQVKTLINGREIFSDLGRDLTIEYVPTEIFSAVDIYKNPSASLIEGGVGGAINMKTHRPFDFKIYTAALGLRSIYYDMADYSKPQISALITNRFKTATGEVGLLLTLARIESGGRQDSIGTEPFYSRYNLVDFNQNGLFPGTTPPAAGSDPGDLVIAPNGGGNVIEYMTRLRQSLNGVVQWRVNNNLELMLELTRIGYEFSRNSAVIYANRGSLLARPGAVFSFADGVTDAANVVRSGAYGDVIYTSNPNYFDRTAFTDQAAFNVQWSPATQLKISGDLAFTYTKRNDQSGNVRIGNATSSTGANLDFDLRGDAPQFHISEFNVADPDAYRLIDIGHGREQASGTGTAVNVEVIRDFSIGPIKNVKLGMRHAAQNILRQDGTRLHINKETSAAFLPEALVPFAYDSFYLSKTDKQLFSNGILGAPFELVRNRTRLCEATNDTICDVTFDPARTFSGTEKSSGLYGEITYELKLGRLPLTGNIGARYHKTHLIINGYRTSNTAEVQAISRKSNYDDLLPSFNTRLELTKKLFLRLAVAKQVTRPKFQELAPNLTLSTQSFSTLIGRSGNPDLRPLHAVSYDGSLEYYFNRPGYAYITIFEKHVDGFIQSVIREEAVAFPDYPGFVTAQISRPQNGGKGRINGVELGMQTTLERSPVPFDGLVLQANYTRVNSHAPGPLAGTSVPLVGLSKNSYNLIGNYEKGRLRARLAYSWRDEYVDTTSGPGSGNLPIYAGPFGTLDASIGFKLNRHIDLTLDAANIQRSQYTSYFGNSDRTRFYNIYDRRLGLTLRLTQ